MENKYPKMAEMKNDIREYGLYEVVEDFVIYEEGNYRLSVNVLLEGDMVAIVLNRFDNDVFSQGAYGMDKKDFMKYDDNDFRSLVGQILNYNMD